MNNKSRVLFTADWHLTDNPRDEYRHEWQAELRDIVRKYNVDVTLIGGDICEEKDRHPATLVNRVVDHIDQLRDYCEVMILKGNHDYSQISHPYWQFLSAIPNVWFVNEVTNWGTSHVLLLPHTRNWQKDWKDINFDQYDVVFAHNTFEGADVGHGHRMKGIPADDIFAPGTRVFAGDVHVPQQLGMVTYVGSPYTINFGDDFAPQVLLLEDGKVTPINCMGPQKMVAVFEYYEDQLQMVSKKADIAPGDIVQARVHIHKNDYAHWQEIVDQIQKWGEQEEVRVFQVKPIVEGGIARASAPRAPIVKRTDQQVFQDYAKRMAIDEATVLAGEKLL